MDRWSLGEDDSTQVKQLLDEYSDESLLKLSVDAHAIASSPHHADSFALDSDLVARFNRLKNPPLPPPDPLTGAAPAAAIVPRLPLAPFDPAEVDILGADLAARLAALKAPSIPSVASSKSSVFPSGNPSTSETVTSTDGAAKSEISPPKDASTAGFGSAEYSGAVVAAEMLDSRNEVEAAASLKDGTTNGDLSNNPTVSVVAEKLDSGNEKGATRRRKDGTTIANPSGQHSPCVLTHSPDQMPSRSNAEATYDTEVQNLLASVSDQIRFHGKGSHGTKPAETTSEPCSEDEISDREVDEMVEWAKDAARLDDGEEEEEEEGLEVQEDHSRLSFGLPPVSSTTLQPVKEKGRGWKFW